VSSDLAKEGCWERHIVTRIVSYLNTRDRGLFLDVGANVGAFTATVAANDNDVIAVEPFRLNVRPRVRGDRAPRPPRPSQVPLIRRTMCGPARLDDRISLYKMGLADSFPGPKMCIWSTNDEINRGNARMTPYFEGRRDFGQDKQKACMEVVYTDTLDHLLFDTHGLARRVDVMKIDIEGFKTRAFRGAARLLASDFKPCQIYFEYQHDATVESGVDRHELFERLTRAGYKLNDFMKNEEVGSFTPEQWDGMRQGDLRAVLDDASCGWSSRGPPPPPPPPRVVGREPPPPPQPALVVVRERTKRIEALEAELTALKTSITPEPHYSIRDGFDRVPAFDVDGDGDVDVKDIRDGFDRVPAFDVDGDGDVDVKDRTLEVMGVVLVLGLAAQLVLRRRVRRRAD
jgi:hypothetical protein